MARAGRSKPPPPPHRSHQTRSRQRAVHLAVLACVISVSCPRVSPQQAGAEPAALKQRFARAEHDAGGWRPPPAHGDAGAEARPPAARILWEWDSRAGAWAAAEDTLWAARFGDGTAEADHAQAFGADSFSSWTHWLANTAQSMVGFEAAASPSAGTADGSGPDAEAPEEDEHEEPCGVEHGGQCGVLHPIQAQHAAPAHAHNGGDGDADPSRPQSHLDKFSSVPPMPGGFPWIDPTGSLARDGVAGSNPKGCPSGGVSVGVDGVVYFLSPVPGKLGETVLVQAQRPKNGTWVFRKIRMPRFSSGVVSCGALDGGPLLGKDILLCSDEDGTMLQWIEGGTGAHDVPLPPGAHACVSCFHVPRVRAHVWIADMRKHARVTRTHTHTHHAQTPHAKMERRRSILMGATRRGKVCACVCVCVCVCV